MCSRPRPLLLPLLVGLFAPLGCMNWECECPQMIVPPHLGGPSPSVAGDISFAQAAQLCLSAGDNLEKKGYVAEALAQYENARKHDPQAPGVARRLAVLYDLQDNAARAESEYLRALREQPRDAELLNDFGYFHYRHNRLTAAESWLRNAVTVDPQCGCAWINLGQVLAHQGRSEESFHAFTHVLRPAEAYSNVGILLAKQGRTAEARSALRQALTLDANLKQARAFLNALPSVAEQLPPNVTLRTPPVPPRLPANGMPQTQSVPPPSLPISSPQTANSLALKKPIHTGEMPTIKTGTLPPLPAPSLLPAYVPVQPTRQRTPPPAPPPLAPRQSAQEEGPILIRTSAWQVEPAAPPTSVATKEPAPLPASVPSKPLTPPQATLTDCQADTESATAPRSP